MNTVTFPPRTAGKVLDDALAAGADAVRSLNEAMRGNQSMDEEERAAERAIRPFVLHLTGSAVMIELLTMALAGRARRDAIPSGEF